MASTRKNLRGKAVKISGPGTLRIDRGGKVTFQPAKAKKRKPAKRKPAARKANPSRRKTKKTMKRGGAALARFVRSGGTTRTASKRPRKRAR